MPRSVVTTVSAVVAIIGSTLTLLAGVMILAYTLLSKSSPAAHGPSNLNTFAVIEAIIMFFGFGGWGLAAGIGLINLKQWARVSTLAFAVILLFVSLGSVVVLGVVIRFPSGNNPSLPSHSMLMVRNGMILFYATLAALGGFWLYFFNRPSVKAQFHANRMATESGLTQLSSESLISAPTPGQPDTPLSITIIGWFLLISSALALLGLLFGNRFLSGARVPFYFLGFFFFGRSGSVIQVVWMVAQMVAAVGLLKLKNWGLFATVGLQCLTAVNAALLVAIPANRARFQQVIGTMIASMNAHQPQPFPFVFPIWIFFTLSFPVVCVILWFLITQRQSFGSASQNLVRQLP